MTIRELHKKLERELEKGHGDYDIKVITSNTSMGSRASTNLLYATEGMDWESGQFNLTTEDKIIKMSVSHPLGKDPIQINNLQNPKNPE